MAFGSSGTRTHIFARFFYVIAHAFSMTLEVFLRRKFGERYFRSVSAIVAIGLVFLYAKLNQGIANPASRLYEMKKHFPDSSLWLDTGITLLVILSLWHLAVIYWRARKGEQWYSRSSGESLLYFKFYPFAQTTFQFLVEPALCFGIGYMLRDMDTVGLWIMTASGFLLLKGQIVYQQEKGKVLDEYDAEIAMRSPAASDDDPGSVTIAVPNSGMNVSLNDLCDRLEPDLKQIVGDIPEVNYVDKEVHKKELERYSKYNRRRIAVMFLNRVIFYLQRLQHNIVQTPIVGIVLLFLIVSDFVLMREGFFVFAIPYLATCLFLGGFSFYLFMARDNQALIDLLEKIENRFYGFKKISWDDDSDEEILKHHLDRKTFRSITLGISGALLFAMAVLLFKVDYSVLGYILAFMGTLGFCLAVTIDEIKKPAKPIPQLISNGVMSQAKIIDVVLGFAKETLKRLSYISGWIALGIVFLAEGSLYGYWDSLNSLKFLEEPFVSLFLVVSGFSFLSYLILAFVLYFLRYATVVNGWYRASKHFLILGLSTVGLIGVYFFSIRHFFHITLSFTGVDFLSRVMFWAIWMTSVPFILSLLFFVKGRRLPEKQFSVSIP